MTQSSEVAQYYKNTEIQTSTTSKCVLLLHKECLHCLYAAQQSDEAISEKCIEKAQNIIVQLQHALILDDSLAKSLFFLYDYCYTQLDNCSDVNIKNAESILKTLSDSFEKLIFPNKFDE